MAENTNITVAYGDGIGPEIMEATLKILKNAGAKINVETIEVGEQMYLKGFTTGLTPQAWETIKRNKILLKSPITTPQGGGYKSLNVTMRKTLGLYSNVRPVVSYPFIKTNHPNINLCIIRENEEDLYAGIEYRQSHNTYQTLKLISRTGCEKIMRYAFEYAVLNNRKKVTCFSKDNIMKMTDGIFHKVFNEVSKDYPQIACDHMIVDIGSAKLANKPEMFDVIATSNLYGDIISDIAAEVSGSVGLAGSANIGTEYAMFEAIHGSAPDIAGKNLANPAGLLNGAIMMLVHIGQPEVATLVHNALLATLESGVHTPDIFNDKTSKKKVGTKEFADEIIKNLGKKPTQIEPVLYTKAPINQNKFDAKNVAINKSESKILVGVDVYLDWSGESDNLAKEVSKVCDGLLKLQMVSCRGLKVWPDPEVGRMVDDFWRLRFSQVGTKTTSHGEIIKLLTKLNDAGFDVAKTENLFCFDEKIGFSLSQGE